MSDLVKLTRCLAVKENVIVNLDHVVQISDRTCRLANGTALPISSLKTKEIQQIWHNYNFDRMRKESLWKRNP